MLFQRALLDGLADGSITLTFRRWRRPGALPGSRHRTAIGVIAIDTVEQVADVTEDEARRAGHPSRAALLAELDRYGDGPIYRIALRHAGADPRVELLDVRGVHRHRRRRMVAVPPHADRVRLT